MYFFNYFYRLDLLLMTSFPSFSNSRQAIVTATERLRHAAGNFYINDKCTGAVVGRYSRQFLLEDTVRRLERHGSFDD